MGSERLPGGLDGAEVGSKFGVREADGFSAGLFARAEAVGEGLTAAEAREEAVNVKERKFQIIRNSNIRVIKTILKQRYKCSLAFNALDN
jgi:hypothetical protein